MGRATVHEYLHIAEAAGLCWEQVRKMDEAELKARLFPDSDRRAEPIERTSTLEYEPFRTPLLGTPKTVKAPFDTRLCRPLSLPYRLTTQGPRIVCC